VPRCQSSLRQSQGALDRLRASGSAGKCATGQDRDVGEILNRTVLRFNEGERVVVDPDADEPLSDGELRDLQQRASDASTPVWVALLPDAAQQEVASGSRLAEELWRANDSEPGTYLVLTPDGTVSAGSTVIGGQSVAIAQAARQAAAQNANGDLAYFLNDFIDRAERAARGETATDVTEDPSALSWGIPLGIIALAGGGGWVIWRRAKRQREAAEAAQLDKLKAVVDQDITAYGEELDRLELDLRSPRLSDEGRDEYARALDLYESAKEQLAAARHPADIQRVTHALEEGRYLLARVGARQDDRPLPERRPPCFFDPRHGPSTEDVEWTPPMGAPRMVPACAADALRVKEGAEPDSRLVPVGGRDRPYWEGGRTYEPYAGGYFTGGLLPGLFWGTMLGSMWGGPYMGDAGADPGADAGGDFGGGDVGGWGGGDFGGGGFGGGDFGGGGGW
jgi:hypothetical protein